MIEELMASVIIQSVDLLLVDKTEITVPLLQALLVKTMRLISESRRPERQDDLLEALLTLLNAYLKEDEDDGNGNDYNDKLRQILPDDDWLHHCLEILLVSLQSTATAAAAAAATTTTTTTTTTPTPSLQASILAFQFVQILLCSSGSKQVAFLPSIKDFCTALVESTLYLLEEGTNKGLYYAIVATNLVLLLMESKTHHHHHHQQQQQQQQQSNDGKYYYQGMAKSLWQASTDFVVQYLEQDTNNIPQEYQAIATETLWKLASTITSSTSFESTNYEEWMAVTMLRLLQQPNSTVSPQVQEWIQLQLANNPTARHALQATAISMISSFSIRHCDDPSPMLSLLFVSSTQQENNDPWQSLAQEYLSDHLMTIGHE
jgi:hypothetical protein